MVAAKFSLPSELNKTGNNVTSSKHGKCNQNISIIFTIYKKYLESKIK